MKKFLFRCSVDAWAHINKRMHNAQNDDILLSFYLYVRRFPEARQSYARAHEK